MKPYGVCRSFDEWPVFKNATRKSARLHSEIKKLLHRRERRTWNNNRRPWKEGLDKTWRLWYNGYYDWL